MKHFIGHWQEITEAISGRMKKHMEKAHHFQNIYEYAQLCSTAALICLSCLAAECHSDLVTKYPKSPNFY